MGNGEVDTPTKTPKSPSTQEQPPPPVSPATVFPEWASYQAYYNSAGTPPMPPPGFFHSSVGSSPQGHPYMWGAQHIMPPYGTPPPYYTMYPHGGLYAHPSVPPGAHPYSPYAMPSPNGTVEAPVAVGGVVELEGRSVEGKTKSPLKRSRGSLGSLNMLTGKGNDMGKASGPSANGASTQSGDSGNEGSSEGSDANSQNSSQQKPACEQGSEDADETQNGTAPSGVTLAAPNQTMLNQTMAIMAIPQNGVTGPTTNLNIGMDYWGGHGATPIATVRGKLPVVPATAAIVSTSLAGSRDGIHSELWLQDERELKRQRRKQSNRESARRSRLRKQAECDELAQRVETLKEENSSLREELDRMREECEKLASENTSLSERLQKHQGEEQRVDDGHSRLDCNSQMTSKLDNRDC
eukprot:TRINITY_DN1964_c1_g1_i1.p1 TRINITY_DN1964_c1_g1~~TRINITY_DN1964_c1_g1_i1.p1  ORF type:complete len:410 (-),score=81.17 TRINITY_DN1964_c1_g1_i1:335-1564(-)